MKTRRNDAFFRELVETTNDLVLRLDRWGRFRYASPSMEKYLGIKPQLCIGRKALSFVHRVDRRTTLDNFKEWISRKRKSAIFENRLISIHGEECHMMWTLNLSYDAGAELVWINCIGRDITQIKTTEKKLRRREEMWNKLLMACPTWIFLCTLEEGYILDLNDAFCRDAGYLKEEVIGRTTKEIGLWPDPEERDRMLAIIKKKGSLDQYPIILNMRNGELREFFWSTTIIRLHGQRCLLSVLVDASELKKTEQELAKTNEELQKRSNKLAEMNSALKVLLNQREEDKSDLESRVWNNIKKMIQPHLNNLRSTKLNQTQIAHLEVAMNRLNEISSRIGESLGRNAYRLSTRELEVVGHIIEGKSNKDIANILRISVHSVESHRFSIRKKIGILGTRTNLRSHLMSFSDYSNKAIRKPIKA